MSRSLLASTGMYALQFAHLSGYKVITVASTKNFDLCKSFGADVVIDVSLDFTPGYGVLTSYHSTKTRRSSVKSRSCPTSPFPARSMLSRVQSRRSYALA